MNVKQFSILLPTLAFVLFFLMPSAYANPEYHKKMQAETKEFVENAKQYISAHGRDPAFIAFNNKNGIFATRSLYMFAIKYNGVLLASANSPELVNKNIIDLKDANDKFITHELIDKAKAGGGWVKYRFYSPQTGKVDCKNSYVIPLDNQYLIGAGYYYPPTKDGQCL